MLLKRLAALGTRGTSPATQRWEGLVFSGALRLRCHEKKTKKIITAFVVPNKSTIFATNMTSHASHRTAHPGRSSSFYVAALNKID